MTDDRTCGALVRALSLTLRALATLLPGSVRSDWLEMWESELWYVDQYLRGRSASVRRLALTRFASGAIPDVMVRADWLRVPSRAVRATLSLVGSGLRPAPVRTLSLLFALAATSATLRVATPLLLLDPPEVATSQDLVRVGRHKADGSFDNVSFPAFEKLVRDSGTFEALAAYARVATTVQPGGDSTGFRAAVTLVSDGYFQVLGITPEPPAGLPEALARSPELPRAVVSRRMWNTHFEEERDGRVPLIRVGSAVALVVGIAPDRFVGIDLARTAPDVWVPLDLHDAVFPHRVEEFGKTSASRNWLWMVGRVGLEGGLAAATAEVRTLMETEFPAQGGARGDAAWVVIPVRGLLPDERREARRLALMLLGASLLVAALVTGRRRGSMGGLARRVGIAVPAILIATEVASRALTLALPVAIAVEPLGGWAGWFVTFALGGLGAIQLPTAPKPTSA